MNFLYKFFMTTKIQTLSNDLEKVIAAANNCNLICSAPIKDAQCLGQDAFIDREYFIFKDVVDDKTSYNIFYDNLHIRMEYGKNSQVYSVHIKKPSENWCFNLRDDKSVDHSHPSTQTFRVYVSYDVPVLDITNVAGSSYIEGNWDKYVYKTLTSFINMIDNLTDATQFNKEYK